MTDTNGHVSPAHLITFGAVQVSRAIYAKVVATSNDFHRSGYSFNIAPPGGGDRPWDMQTAMRNDYIAGRYQQPPYYLSPPPSPEPDIAGRSRHGFALAIDVQTNASIATRNAIMARNGWHQWNAKDPNHFEPDEFNVLVAPPESAFAGGGATPLDNTTTAPKPPKEPEMFIVDASKLQNYRNGVWLMAPGYLHGFTPAEWNDWGGNLQSAGVWVFTPPTDAGFDSLLSTLTADRGAFPGRGASPDLATLSSSVSKAVTGAIAAAPNPSADTIAKAVDTALANDFAAVPAAVVQAEGAALGNG